MGGVQVGREVGDEDAVFFGSRAQEGDVFGHVEDAKEAIAIRARSVRWLRWTALLSEGKEAGIEVRIATKDEGVIVLMLMIMDLERQREA